MELLSSLYVVSQLCHQKITDNCLKILCFVVVLLLWRVSLHFFPLIKLRCIIVLSSFLVENSNFPFCKLYRFLEFWYYIILLHHLHNVKQILWDPVELSIEQDFFYGLYHKWSLNYSIIILRVEASKYHDVLTEKYLLLSLLGNGRISAVVRFFMILSYIPWKRGLSLMGSSINDFNMQE